jgi:hypothetical protein
VDRLLRLHGIVHAASLPLLRKASGCCRLWQTRFSVPWDAAGIYMANRCACG